MAVKNHKGKDLSQLLRKYRDRWIALSSDEERVVASGTSMKKVMEEAQKQGEKDAIITRVPAEFKAYIL